MIGDIEDLLDFAGMLNKEVWICTSYDSSDRFRDEHEYSMWLENIKACQKEGHKVVVNTVLSNEFIHDDKFVVPEGVDFKLQAYFAGERWLYGEYEKDVSTAEYNEDLKQKISDLPSRSEVLNGTWITQKLQRIMRHIMGNIVRSFGIMIPSRRNTILVISYA